MKAKLTFNLPEDQEQFNAATKAMEWALLVWDLDQQCRDWVKYDNHNFKDIQETLQGVRRIIYEAMVEKGVTFPE
jgi:hypothetical protein|tara:strand:+ start:833 stop:1057 length:225 start_codon:yes stop_codon:yes gene_type:complete